MDQFLLGIKSNVKHKITVHGFLPKHATFKKLIEYFEIITWTDGVRLLAERYDTKTNVKMDGFRSQLQASYMSSQTAELWYNETVCLWIIIYIYIYIYIYGMFRQ